MGVNKTERLLYKGIKYLTLRGANIFTDWAERGQSGEIADGNAAVLFSRGLGSGETMQVSQCAFLHSNGQAAPTGTSLRIVTLDNAGGGTSEVTIVSGDGNTVYDDVVASNRGDSIAQYKNTSGSDVTVAIVVDNGEFGAGTGSTEDLFAGAIARFRSDI